MNNVFINSIGKFLPGEPIANDRMEDYLGKVNGRASKVKNRILKSNGIQHRYYALNERQQPTYLNSQMAALAVRNTLSGIDLEPSAIDLLAAGTTWADLLVPGFANMVHGELPEFPPLETLTSMGVCCAGIGSLKYAASQVKLGEKQNAISVASEQPSRLFTHTHYEAETAIQAGQNLSFDTEFLRWMLSDGAGAVLLQNQPNRSGISLKIEWIELVSHANAYPVCMYAGAENETAQKSWMDYPSYVEAAQAGALNLRQNIRLLDNVVKLGVEGWLKLIAAGRVNPDEIDWLLCHYSSHFFKGQIVELLDKAGCLIPESKWFTNLYTRGNTGCASIYLMLEELFHSQNLQPGQKIFCFVPESGRFTTAYMLLTVVKDGEIMSPLAQPSDRHAIVTPPVASQNPQPPLQSQTPAAYLMHHLALVWLEFERKLQSIPIIRKLNRGEFTIEDYQALLTNLRPQVVEGARWIARAASNMTDFRLRSTFIGHAQAEHRDFQMLEQNYISVGGVLEDIVSAEKNIGSEALSAFIFHQASQENPVSLVGSMFIIEGLGNNLAGKWATQIKETLKLTNEQVSFLGYHAANDDSHIDKLNAILNAEWMTKPIADRIIKTAKVTARLYLLQLEEISIS
ncbi:beta-ketoacyl-ACP synthase III [Chamaesiphon sp. GL140_3_metabinner_50]|uniref:beta-ketoacyl-ACP synthase III n=1 Tax=Chamaesiphon sp. GL140_3_metabinner_50 TaxID=2970812 RepID=UPI0025DA0871|nr:beta-ketoacyl-ACP synthase III [Chamaesiphon sp. GL140_3_metabinner_50]